MIAFQMAFVFKVATFVIFFHEVIRVNEGENPMKFLGSETPSYFRRICKQTEKMLMVGRLDVKMNIWGKAQGTVSREVEVIFFLGGETSNILLNFIPILGKDPIWLFIFQMPGWNHQL